MILLAQLCPKNAEAIIFSLLAGSSNLGSNIAQHLGAVELELLGMNLKLDFDIFFSISFSFFFILTFRNYAKWNGWRAGSV